MIRTDAERDCFFRFKMKPLPLVIMVFIARGDYAKDAKPQPLHYPIGTLAAPSQATV